MLGLSVFHLVVPVAFVVWVLNSRSYERNTRLLVERERAKAMLALKNSQQSERDDAFQRQQAIIADAKKKLLEHRAAQPVATEATSPTVPPQAPAHKVGEDVWNSPLTATAPAEAPPVVAPPTESPMTAPRPVQVEESIVEDVYTASDDTADADTVH